MRSASECRRTLSRTTGFLHLIAFGTALVGLDLSLRINSAQVDVLPDSAGLGLIAIGSIGLAALRGGRAYETLATIAAALASSLFLLAGLSFFLPALSGKLEAASPFLRIIHTAFPILICESMRRLSLSAEEPSISRSWWRSEQFFLAAWTGPVTLTSIIGPDLFDRFLFIWLSFSVILLIAAVGYFLWSIRLQSLRFAS